MRFFFQFVFLFAVAHSSAQIKILFDASQAEMAGNADWVIDANTYNIGFNGSGAAVTGMGNEANPSVNPSPAQSAITASTPETYWNGALSSWAIDLVKLGYQVETLPYNGTISYGNASNAQDLGNYKVFIVCEPNIRFTNTEKTALINFVQNGGGLFMIADHDQSDRNGDGWDSPSIWNDLMNTNSVQTDPFGLQFSLVDISETSYNTNQAANDTIVNGVNGFVYGVKFSNGAMLTANTGANASAAGVIYEAGAAQDTDSILLACANYGNGRVAAFGDSSPGDDGTGDNNDTLFYGYTDLLVYHRRLLLNSTIWLAGNAADFSTSLKEVIYMYPNPAEDFFVVETGKDLSQSFKLYDLTGKSIMEKAIDHPGEKVDISALPQGCYFLVITSGDKTRRRKIMITGH